MYKYFKTFFFSVLVLGYESLYGQSQDSLTMISSKSQFENAIFSDVASYEDSLSNSLYLNGVLFFRFRTNQNGQIADVTCAHKQPALLISIIKTTLQKMKLKDAADSSIYVLPIIFDYSRGPLWEFENAENHKKKYTANYDVNDLDSYININNNGFFDIAFNDKEQWGIKSLFLPWITISRSVIYSYKDKVKTQRAMQSHSKTKTQQNILK